MSDVREVDHLDDDTDRAVEGLFTAIAGMGLIDEGRAALLRVSADLHGQVIARAIDQLLAKLPGAPRRDVEAAIKRDLMRLFDFPTDGNA
jgi:hypothetical protein